MKDTTIDQNVFSDAIVDVVDGIRRSVHGSLGDRPWNVDIVTRTWSGGRRGVGTPSETVVRIEPTPQVKRVTRDRMGPAGREAEGDVTLTEVSLRYAYAELRPQPKANQEIGYRLTDARGTRQRPIYYVLSADPVPRRGDKEGDEIDWYVLLKETSDMADLDGVNA